MIRLAQVAQTLDPTHQGAVMVLKQVEGAGG